MRNVACKNEYFVFFRKEWISPGDGQYIFYSNSLIAIKSREQNPSGYNDRDYIKSF